MAGYDAYYSQYVLNSQSGAYDATFMSPKPRADDYMFDASHPTMINDSWNISESDVNANLRRNLITNENMNMITSHTGWQQQSGYFGATGDMIPNHWDIAQLDPTANGFGRYTQSIPQGGDSIMPGLTMSSPVNINSSYAGPYPRSWNSELSVTPPNEYHSSGSDGGSDDLHSQFLNFDSPKGSGSSRQSSASPPTSTIEVQPVPIPAKPSYYRSRLDKAASKAQPAAVDLPAPAKAVPAATPACAPQLMVQKKRKACGACKRRKVSCGVPAAGSKCNQCLRTGADCDLFAS